MRPTFAEVEHALLGRWPETKLDPTLDRIGALCRLIGDPQAAYPVIQLTGTNGKTSTARMIDSLVRALGLRTGRFTSPHLQSMTERICLDGEPLGEEAFVDAFADIAPFAQIVDDSSEHPLSFFEMLVAMAYAAFADAPVDAAIIEVGMGGAWDATNVVEAAVAVVAPIDVDHAAYLGDSPADVAVEKAGIIKAGSHAVLARQPPDVLEVLMERILQVGATPLVEGHDFGVVGRDRAVDGQLITLQGLHGRYEDIYLPLHGSHQAHNAALALVAVESFAARGELGIEIVREAFAEVRSPGRMEVVRQSPAVVLDAAHNPHGARSVVDAVTEAFEFSPLIGVVGVMSDKDVEEMLRTLEPVLARIVCTQNSTERSLPAAELAAVAEGIFGTERVLVAAQLDEALETGIALAESSTAVGSGGVLVTGSVVTVGEARALLKRGDD